MRQSDSLPCDFQDQFLKCKIANERQTAISYPSYSNYLKKIHIHYTGIFVTPSPNKNPQPLSHWQQISQVKNMMYIITMHDESKSTEEKNYKIW